MAKKFWWPGTAAGQQLVLTQFGEKIDEYGERVGLSADDVQQIKDICDSMAKIIIYLEEYKAHQRSLFAWRDSVFKGKSIGNAVENPPAMPPMPNIEALEGSFKMLTEFRRRILNSPDYDRSIGIDMKLYGSEITPEKENDIRPNINFTVVEGNQIKLKCRMNRMQAVKIEYAPKDGDYRTVALLTNTPATFEITPENPGNAETGSIRAIFTKNNEHYGNFSPLIPVTIAG